MLSAARAKRPELTWLEADLARPRRAPLDDVDLAVLAGNVMVFVEPGTEGQVLTAVSARLARAVCWSRVSRSGPTGCPWRITTAGRVRRIAPIARWATWDREPFTGGDYAVSVHRRPPLRDD